MDQPTEAEVVARVEERPDLVERIGRGDSGAIVDLLEHATGAKAASVKVTLPRGIIGVALAPVLVLYPEAFTRDYVGMVVGAIPGGWVTSRRLFDGESEPCRMCGRVVHGAGIPADLDVNGAPALGRVPAMSDAPKDQTTTIEGHVENVNVEAQPAPGPPADDKSQDAGETQSSD